MKGKEIGFPELKIWPTAMRRILSGEKRHEVREAEDWTPRRGMSLILREWDPGEQAYTGMWAHVRIGHVTEAELPSPLPEGLVCFDIEVLAQGFESEVDPAWAARGSP